MHFYYAEIIYSEKGFTGYLAYFVNWEFGLLEFCFRDYYAKLSWEIDFGVNRLFGMLLVFFTESGLAFGYCSSCRK